MGVGAQDGSIGASGDDLAELEGAREGEDVRQEREDEGDAMEELYDEVLRLTRRFSRNETNPLLMMLRTEEGSMTEMMRMT